MASNTTICANSIASNQTSFHTLRPAYVGRVTLTAGGTAHNSGISIPADFVLTGYSLKTVSISDTAGDNITSLGIAASAGAEDAADPNLYTQTAIAHIVGVADTSKRYYSADSTGLAAGRSVAANLTLTTDADPANSTTVVEIELYGYHML